MLSSLERRSDRWDTDPDSARAALSAAVSLVLRLLGRDHDPAKSREHVLLCVLAERRLAASAPADLGSLLDDLEAPPLERIGALEIDEFISKRERRELSAALNTLLASPTFASWRQGMSLDIGAWMTDAERTPATIVSVAHLDDEERALVLGVLLEELLSWVRSLSGSQRLRALVVFDEVYGFLPPYPANPPTKRPLVALMKQARAFGVGPEVHRTTSLLEPYEMRGWCKKFRCTRQELEAAVRTVGHPARCTSCAGVVAGRSCRAVQFAQQSNHGRSSHHLRESCCTPRAIRGRRGDRAASH